MIDHLFEGIFGHHHHHGGDDFGLGLIFPAIIVGKVISEIFDQSAAAQSRPVTPPAPAAPRPTPAAAGPEAAPTARCQHCHGTITDQFAYCPHCGRAISPRVCQYCSQALTPAMRFCTHCGGPVKY